MTQLKPEKEYDEVMGSAESDPDHKDKKKEKDKKKKQKSAFSIESRLDPVRGVSSDSVVNGADAPKKETKNLEEAEPEEQP